MSKKDKTLRICPNGHRYYKSSDCPVCPECEGERQPSPQFMSQLSAPARRALEREGINSLKKLSTYMVSEILSLHGMGPSSIPKLTQVLKENKLSFNRKSNRK